MCQMSRYVVSISKVKYVSRGLKVAWEKVFSDNTMWTELVETECTEAKLYSVARVFFCFLTVGLDLSCGHCGVGL